MFAAIIPPDAREAAAGVPHSTVSPTHDAVSDLEVMETAWGFAPGEGMGYDEEDGSRGAHGRWKDDDNRADGGEGGDEGSNKADGDGRASAHAEQSDRDDGPVSADSDGVADGVSDGEPDGVSDGSSDGERPFVRKRPSPFAVYLADQDDGGGGDGGRGRGHVARREPWAAGEHHGATRGELVTRASDAGRVSDACK